MQGGHDEAAAGDTLAACGRGELPPGLALMRLLLAMPDRDRLRSWLGEREGMAAERLASLLERHGAATGTVLELAAGPPRDLQACARLFDRAVAANPAAAVAAYSLGDEARLAAATAELAALLDRLDVLGPQRRVLDLGCGIGRLELALAGKVAAITGIDLSPGMIRVARGRCRGIANVTLHETDGRDLRRFATATFETVLAVDCFPYLYHAGGQASALAHAREAARVLTCGGDLVILNLSYRGDPARDRADAAAIAAEAGLRLARAGTADLALWDGLTFHFKRAG